jgi:hypothetical protein
MYFAVLGDMSAALSAEKVFVIGEKFFAALFGQPFVLAKIISPKIPDQDAARSFVILLPTKRRRQVEVRKSDCPSRMPTLSFDECKAAKPVVDIIPILDLELPPVRLWNFDGARLSRKVTGLRPESAVERIQKNQSKSCTMISGRVLPLYLPKGTTLQYIVVIFPLLNDFRLRCRTK